MKDNSSYRFLLIFLVATAIFFVSYFSANLAQEAFPTSASSQPFLLSSPLANQASSTSLLKENGTSLRSSVGLIPDFHLKADLAAPDVQLQAALIEDLKTRTRYFSLNIYRSWPTASLTKLMTMVITLQKFKLDDKIEITSSDIAPYDDFMRVGDIYSVEDMMKLMLALSSNTAANAMANHYGFSDFINLMNNQASDWGMSQTHYDESIGLSPSNVTSAADLEKLAYEIYNNYPFIFNLSRNAQQKVVDLNSGIEKTVSSIDYFAGEPDFLGGKTGSTDEAQGNLVSVFDYEGRPILVIVLGSGDRFKDTQDLFNWFKNSYTF
ncbi:serine hydrolase [Patescibacteria group bacterium]|nr:serine hydrolase [Patescibacteria group bacterium]MCL5733537.1 serine hydrolase [Patescibacteria group bacterium]